MVVFFLRNLCPLFKRGDLRIIIIMKRIITMLSLLISVPSVAATNFPHGLQLGIGVSATSGFNVALGYYDSENDGYFLTHFGIRADFASAAPLKSAIDSAIDSYMRDGRDVGDGVKIDEGKFDAWHGMFVLDYYPFAGAWRISGGYAWGNAELDAAIFGEISTAPSQRFYFYLAGDHYYYNGNKFDGSAAIDWRYHGPYLGTGFDWNLFCGLSLFADIGVVFTNRSAKLSLDIPHEQLYIYNKATGVWAPVTIAALDTDVARAEHDANRKLSDLRVYPMVKLGFAYRF